MPYCLSLHSLGAPHCSSALWTPVGAEFRSLSTPTLSKGTKNVLECPRVRNCSFSLGSTGLQYFTKLQKALQFLLHTPAGGRLCVARVLQQNRSSKLRDPGLAPLHTPYN